MQISRFIQCSNIKNDRHGDNHKWHAVGCGIFHHFLRHVGYHNDNHIGRQKLAVHVGMDWWASPLCGCCGSCLHCDLCGDYHGHPLWYHGRSCFDCCKDGCRTLSNLGGDFHRNGPDDSRGVGRPVANDLLNDALRLDNELSALAATCSLRSVSKVQINHLGLQNPL